MTRNPMPRAMIWTKSTTSSNFLPLRPNANTDVIGRAARTKIPTQMPVIAKSSAPTVPATRLDSLGSSSSRSLL